MSDASIISAKCGSRTELGDCNPLTGAHDISSVASYGIRHRVKELSPVDIPRATPSGFGMSNLTEDARKSIAILPSLGTVPETCSSSSDE